jgi:hypothetical protein
MKAIRPVQNIIGQTASRKRPNVARFATPRHASDGTDSGLPGDHDRSESKQQATFACVTRRNYLGVSSCPMVEARPVSLVGLAWV